MIHYSVDITVDRPADEVFPFLADVTRHASWMGGSNSEPISEGPMRTGYRYRQSIDEGDFEIEVTAFQPGRLFAARTISGPFSWEGSFEVVPDGEATSRVMSSGAIALSGIRRLAEPFARGEVQRREHGELVRLKDLAEQQPVGAATGTAAS